MGSPGVEAGKSSMTWKMGSYREGGSGSKGGKDFPVISFYGDMMLFEPHSTHRMAQRWTKHRTVLESHPWKQSTKEVSNSPRGRPMHTPREARESLPQW